ncbi:hypothetical protein C8F01DRAFT_1099909 [Mycena amicta]|nr:hypothetical protein C8F01DRAFT_1099909 [Mycena amicta]
MLAVVPVRKARSQPRPPSLDNLQQAEPPATSDTNPPWTRPNAEASSSKPRVSAARSWPSLAAIQPDTETRWATQSPASSSTRFRPPNPSSAGSSRPSKWSPASADSSRTSAWKTPASTTPSFLSKLDFENDLSFSAPPQPAPRTAKPPLVSGGLEREVAPHLAPNFSQPQPSALRPPPRRTLEIGQSRTRQATLPKPDSSPEEDVYIPSVVSVGNLARLLNVKLDDLQDKMHRSGMGEQSSFDHVLTSDYAVLLAEEFGRKPIVNDDAAFDLYPPAPHPDPQSLPNRPPVVTIMGHVDHGKTTLLDTLRSSSVAQGEVGGITQHIGAFSVPVPSSLADEAGPQTITFLDTPGHAAFSAMRARGARVTDIIVLVVAADDGVMPQTREVIELIKKDREKVSVVVAINKVDKPGANIDAVQKALLVEDIHLEEMGGDVPAVHVSGLTGQGLPELLDTLSLLAEIQDYSPIATVLVLRGAIEPGAHILCGVHHAKVRIMQDSNGQTVTSASPGMAVMVSGWKSLPNAGDEVMQASESDIKRAIINRKRMLDIDTAMVDVEAINSSRQQERERRQAEATAEAAGKTAAVKATTEEPSGPKELRLLIKADVSGSAEAVEGALQGIGNHLAISKVIGSSVGDVTESDVMTAKAVGGTIVGFSVNSSRAVETLAAQNDVPIVTDAVIYRLMEQVKERVIRLLPVTYETKVLGEAKVLQLFEITVKGKKLKTVAGSRILNGIVEKIKSVRVVRDGAVVYQGTFETMRHFKKDVTELRKGTECGLNLAGFDDLQVDDVIQAYDVVEKPGVL